MQNDTSFCLGTADIKIMKKPKTFSRFLLYFNQYSNGSKNIHQNLIGFTLKSSLLALAILTSQVLFLSTIMGSTY